MLQLAAAQSVQANHPRPWVVSIMATLQIRVALMQKNVDAIERWQQAQVCNYVRTFEQRALAQIYLAQGQTERALTILEEQLHIAQETQQFGRVIDIRALQALAYQKQHATRKALQALEQALVLGEPERYIRSFVDKGPALRDLLKTLLAQQTAARAPSSYPVSTHYLHQLLTAFGASEDLQPPRERAQSGTGSIKGLSKREIEIIHLIVSGLSTREIAAKIILAENTVKWHVRKIYEKLQVHNRAQIILKAQKLGI